MDIGDKKQDFCLGHIKCVHQTPKARDVYRLLETRVELRGERSGLEA